MNISDNSKLFEKTGRKATDLRFIQTMVAELPKRTFAVSLDAVFSFVGENKIIGGKYEKKN